MKGKGNLKAKGFCLIPLLLILCIVYPMHLFGQAENPQKQNKIEVVGGLINVDVEDAEIPDVLKEIEKGTGVKITVGEKLVGQKVTASLENKDVEDALREILREQYYVQTYARDVVDKEKKTLKEVKVKGVAIGSKPASGNQIALAISYGAGEKQIGAAKGAEGSSRGPMSFAVDDEDNIYICDTVNNRIQVFSPVGTYLFTIPIEIFAADIVIDKSGHIYVYDGSKKFHEYDKTGRLIASLDVDVSPWIGGPMHIVNDEIYVYTCDFETCGDLLIARISNDLLVVPSEEKSKRFRGNGRQGLSGKTYMTSKDSERFKVDIAERDKTSVLLFPCDLLTSQFIGEDQKGNFYIETLRYDEKRDMVREVQKINSSNDYLNSISIPKSGVFLVPAIKDTLVSKRGSIFRFLPEEDGLKLSIFHEDR